MPTPTDGPRRINAIRLPGDGPAARIWNALVDRGGRDV